MAIDRDKVQIRDFVPEHLLGVWYERLAQPVVHSAEWSSLWAHAHPLSHPTDLVELAGPSSRPDPDSGDPPGCGSLHPTVMPGHSVVWVKTWVSVMCASAVASVLAQARTTSTCCRPLTLTTAGLFLSQAKGSLGLPHGSPSPQAFIESLTLPEMCLSLTMPALF